MNIFIPYSNWGLRTEGRIKDLGSEDWGQPFTLWVLKSPHKLKTLQLWTGCATLVSHLGFSVIEGFLCTNIFGCTKIGGTNPQWWVWNFAFAFGRLRASWDVECLTVVETQINTFPQSACPQTPSRTWQTSFNWKSEQLLFHWSFHLSMHWGCHFPIFRCVSSDMMIIFCKNSWKPQTKKDISWSSQSLSFSFLVEIFVIMVLSSLVLFSSIERKVSDTRRKL